LVSVLCGRDLDVFPVICLPSRQVWIATTGGCASTICATDLQASHLIIDIRLDVVQVSRILGHARTSMTLDT
jgi:hypothetical protein